MKKRKEGEEKVTGKVSLKDVQRTLNESAGYEVAINLNENDVTRVKEWISTGSKILDYTIARGIVAGIPQGRVTELAGLSQAGKSYMACLIAVNAQKQGYDVVYFDAEKGIAKDFLAKMGCDFDKMLYIRPGTVEELFEIIEKCLLSVNSENKLFFVWDSFAMTPTRELTESEGVDPRMHGMRKALVVNNAWQKLLIPFTKAEATMVITNHLRVNTDIPPNVKFPSVEQLYRTPGGSTLAFIYDMRLWLINPRSKSSYIMYKEGEDGTLSLDSEAGKDGWKAGSTVRVKVIKSRHGTYGRECEFKILWGDEERVGVQEEDNIMEVVKNSEFYSAGAWHSLKYENGEEIKFRGSEFMSLYNNDPKFYRRIDEILKKQLIEKFQKKIGNIKDYVNLEENVILTPSS
jgi:recombination protein RecA